MKEPEDENEKNPMDPESLRKYKEGYKAYGKYMSAGFQMVAPVIIGALVGHWLDERAENTKPVYTIVLSSIAIVLAMYMFIRQFLKKSD